MADDTLVLWLMLAAGLSVAACGALGTLFLYATIRLRQLPKLKPVGPVRLPGNGFLVAGAFAIFIVTTSSVQTLLLAAGFYHALYGNDFPTGWPDAAASTIRYLWAAALAFPVQVGLMLWLVRKNLDALIGSGWQRNAIAGYLTWLMVTPAAFCVFALANLAHAWLTGQPPDKHPLTALGAAGGKREWTLFVMQTVVLAPILEEFLFRGLLLPWLAQMRPGRTVTPLSVPPSRRPIAVMIIAVGVALLLQVEDVQKARVAGDLHAFIAHLVPFLFFLALIPLFYLVSGLERLRRHLRIHSRQHVQAILASSALFAAVHAHVWPSPVPLLVLAIGLGYLYLRTLQPRGADHRAWHVQRGFGGVSADGRTGVTLYRFWRTTKDKLPGPPAKTLKLEKPGWRPRSASAVGYFSCPHR